MAEAAVDTAPATTEVVMTEEQRFLFDLQGYVVVPDALSVDQLRVLNTILDEHIAEKASDERTHRFGGLLDWGEPYRSLIDNPRVRPHVEQIVGQRFRLDHLFLDVCGEGKGPIGTTLHGSSPNFDPAQYYRFDKGRMHNGLTVVAYNLHDVNPGDGGTGVIPGSHKSNFHFPNEWRDLEEAHPRVDHLTGPAGTAVIFTEALLHGTLPWRGVGQRRTAFYKFSPHAVSWSAGQFNAEDYEGLTERETDILEGPNARYGGRRR
jgi:hypothetical protein